MIAGVVVVMDGSCARVVDQTGSHDQTSLTFLMGKQRTTSNLSPNLDAIHRSFFGISPFRYTRTTHQTMQCDKHRDQELTKIHLLGCPSPPLSNVIRPFLTEMDNYLVETGSRGQIRGG